MRRFVPLALTAALAAVAAVLLAYQWIDQPTTLRVAVGPLGGDDTRLVAAMAQYLGRERSSVRLKLVMTDGVAESARTAEEGRADLAVVRSDVAIPAKTQTVAILHRDAALIVAAPGVGITKVADLAGHRVGVLRGSEANRRLLDTVLRHYEVDPASVATVPAATPEALEAMLREHGVEAAFAVGAPTGRTLGELVGAALAARSGAPGTAPGTAPGASGPLDFVPINEAGALAQRSPALESLEIVRGAFGGTPPRPAEGFTTLGVSHRLVALSTIDDGTISELARLLFVMRPAISAEVPLANRIEGPDTSKSSSLPVHPGAIAYYDGEVQTFFEKWGDWFYFVVMLLSIAGSTVAGLMSSVANRNRARDVELLGDLLAIVRAARDAPGEAELDAMSGAADEILAAALARAGGGGLDSAGVAAFTLGLDQARGAIHERRGAIREGRAGSHGPRALAAAPVAPAAE